MSSLPPGVTDSMLEPTDPACGACGHVSSMHYEVEDMILNADGSTKFACDALVTMFTDKVQCHCEGYKEGEYEPDYDEDD